MPVMDIGDFTNRRCKGGMVESYMEYAIHQESPSDFHLWTLLSMVAAAMGRQCFCSMGMFETYPNMYIILVGESAITHKSTAISMGLRPFRDALPEVPQLSQKMSPESLINVMKSLSEDENLGRAEAYLESSELANLLGKATQDDGLLKILTEFWDCPNYFSYATMSRGIENVKDICLNLIGGSTQKWLKSSVPDTALEGGFFSRLILVYRPPKGEKNPQPQMSAQQREALENVKHDLGCIRQNMQGEFIVDQEAQQMFNEWYHDHNHPEKAESFMRGYYGRKGAFLQKVAMCLSASYSDDMRITYEDMSLALRLLNENETFAKDMVKYMGTTVDGAKHETVANLIKRGVLDVPPPDAMLTKLQIQQGDYESIKVRGIRHSDLLRKLSHRLKRDDVIEVIDALWDAGTIRKAQLPPGNAKAYIWLDDEIIGDEG